MDRGLKLNDKPAKVGNECPRKSLKGDSVKGTYEWMQQLGKEHIEILFIVFLSHNFDKM